MLKKDVYELLVALKKQIRDDFRSEGMDVPSMDVTFGYDGGGDWGWQTGDTCFTGGAYGYGNWYVITLTRKSNSRKLAREVVEGLKDQLGF